MRSLLGFDNVLGGFGLEGQTDVNVWGWMGSVAIRPFEQSCISCIIVLSPIHALQ